MGDLTLRQEARIQLAEQAEAYIQQTAQTQNQHSDSLSHSQYDAESSRREWAEQHT